MWWNCVDSLSLSPSLSLSLSLSIFPVSFYIESQKLSVVGGRESPFSPGGLCVGLRIVSVRPRNKHRAASAVPAACSANPRFMGYSLASGGHDAKRTTNVLPTYASHTSRWWLLRGWALDLYIQSYMILYGPTFYLIPIYFCYDMLFRIFTYWTLILNSYTRFYNIVSLRHFLE